MSSAEPTVEELSDELPPGKKLLQGQYVIESFLNSGGFGMTYIARDSLNRKVVIKECFPAVICTRSDSRVKARSRAQTKDFNSIVRSFVREAQRLSQLTHPNIVGIHQVFEDNGTAYMVLDHIDGQDLLQIIEDDREALPPVEVRRILVKLLEAVKYMHEQSILHRDISPDNILLTAKCEPVLIDFGAAREAATQKSKVLSELLVVKDGYSPQEFYLAGSEQNRSSDLYALAATFYHLLTGEAPPSSQQRLAQIAAQNDDPYTPVGRGITGYDSHFFKALDKALRIFPKERLQSADDWLIEVDVEKRRKEALAQAERDKNIDLTIANLVAEARLKAKEDTAAKAAAEAAEEAAVKASGKAKKAAAAAKAAAEAAEAATIARLKSSTDTSEHTETNESEEYRAQDLTESEEQADQPDNASDNPYEEHRVFSRYLPLLSGWRRKRIAEGAEPHETNQKRKKSPIRKFGRAGL